MLARPGESWERTQVIEIGGGQTLSFRKKFEYKGTEKKGDKELDKIATKVLEVKYNTEPDSNLAVEARQKRSESLSPPRERSYLTVRVVMSRAARRRSGSKETSRSRLRARRSRARWI